MHFEECAVEDEQEEQWHGVGVDAGGGVDGGAEEEAPQGWQVGGGAAGLGGGASVRARALVRVAVFREAAGNVDALVYPHTHHRPAVCGSGGTRHQMRQRPRSQGQASRWRRRRRPQQQARASPPLVAKALAAANARVIQPLPAKAVAATANTVCFSLAVCGSAMTSDSPSRAPRCVAVACMHVTVVISS